MNGNGNDDRALPFICYDSEGVLGINTGNIKQRKKHIDVCYHNSRNLHERRVVEYEYVNASNDPSDIFTEAFAGDRHE